MSEHPATNTLTSSHLYSPDAAIDNSEHSELSAVSVAISSNNQFLTSLSHKLDMPSTAKLQRSESLGPNLQSRLEALEAAMGVRLNLAKSQGRHSVSNTANPSPMQLSPTSTMSAVGATSLSVSTRHNLPTRSGQGIQRSASSCDAENRPNPIKRLKPSSPTENSSSTTVAAIATMKKYPPPVRRPLISSSILTTPTQSKQSTPIKQRSSPMDTSSPRLSRSSTTSNNSSNYRTPIGISPNTSNSSSPKSTTSNSTPHLSRAQARKQRSLLFGEQFSDEILKTNLLWIDHRELDDESRTEIMLQFGSMDNYLQQQTLFFRKQQQQLKLASKNKTMMNRSRFPLSLPKKERLELL